MLQQLPQHWTGFVARSCNTSPLHQILERDTGEVSRDKEFRQTRLSGPETECWGIAKLVRQRGFDPVIPRFESWYPSHFLLRNLLPFPLAVPKFTTQDPRGRQCPKLVVFTGNANPELAKAMVNNLNLPIGNADVGTFSDGEVAVEIQENVRGKDVFIVQSTCNPTNNNLMELLVMADALRRSSAGRITAVVPYFGYARQDRRVRSARGADYRQSGRRHDHRRWY